MITVRPATERGHANHGWLDTHHTFSFANYYDPAHMGFRALRVINEDRVAAGAGFPTHPHRDMEIISYVLDGAIEHRDSMGNGSVIRAGDVQRMTAGTGVFHSEFNPSRAEPLHFLQIWLLPNERGLTPGYEQRSFSLADRTNRLRLVASPDGAGDSVSINQDVSLYSSMLSADEQVEHELDAGRHAWLQVISGAVVANDNALAAGDGAAISEESLLRIRASEDAHFILFDLA